MIPEIIIRHHGLARKNCDLQRLWLPHVKYDFCRTVTWLLAAEELNLEVVTFDKRVNGDSFKLFAWVALCCYHKRNLTWLEVIINWGVCLYDRLIRQSRIIINAAFCFCVSIPLVAFTGLGILDIFKSVSFHMLKHWFEEDCFWVPE